MSDTPVPSADDALDLDQIAKRWVAASAVDFKRTPVTGTLLLCDIPALLDEVRRLRAVSAPRLELIEALEYVIDNHEIEDVTDLPYIVDFVNQSRAALQSEDK